MTKFILTLELKWSATNIDMTRIGILYLLLPNIFSVVENVEFENAENLIEVLETNQNSQSSLAYFYSVFCWCCCISIKHFLYLAISIKGIWKRYRTSLQLIFFAIFVFQKKISKYKVYIRRNKTSSCNDLA